MHIGATDLSFHSLQHSSCAFFSRNRLVCGKGFKDGNHFKDMMQIRKLEMSLIAFPDRNRRPE
jgi:hypothetical protein